MEEVEVKSLKDLSNEQLGELAAWGKSDSYEILKSLLKAIKNHHASMFLNEIASSPTEWSGTHDALVRAGRFKEDEVILKLPEQANSILEKRKKNENNAGI